MSEGEDKPEVLGLLSNLVLLGTAGWGVWTCREHPFITAGFGLFAVRGLIGAVAYFAYQSESLRSAFDFEKTLRRLEHALYNLSYPLYSMEVMNITKFEPEILKYFLLYFPIGEITVLDLEKAAVYASHGASAIFIIICDFQQSHWYYIFSLLGFIAEESVDSKMCEATRIMVMAAAVGLYATLINQTIPNLLFKDS
nr:uncharacterized protein LOC106688475 isoform X2 [Halyomorpha halys]